MSVALVGAGPGDPELITVRGLARVRAAEVLVYDRLVAPELVAEAPGRRIARDALTQDEVNALLVEHGRRSFVVRLKGGDPFVFGRGGEEAEALRAAGVAVEVIGGLTAGIAAPAAVGIPVTDRRCAPGVALVTGHVKDDGREPDWAALVKSGLTLVVYMGVSRATAIRDALRGAGMAEAMPAAVVSAAHTPRQRHALCSLGTLVETVEREALASPAVLVVGPVAALGLPSTASHEALPTVTVSA